jgi:hypothetical protein
MSIWGWVAIGVVVLALILFALVALGTARRLVPLQRAAADPSVQRDVAALQVAAEELNTAVNHLAARAQVTQERAMALKASKSRTTA